MLEGGRGGGGGEKVSLLSLSPFFALLFPLPLPPETPDTQAILKTLGTRLPGSCQIGKIVTHLGAFCYLNSPCIR